MNNSNYNVYYGPNYGKEPSTEKAYKERSRHIEEVKISLYNGFNYTEESICEEYEIKQCRFRVCIDKDTDKITSISLELNTPKYPTNYKFLLYRTSTTPNVDIKKSDIIIDTGLNRGWVYYNCGLQKIKVNNEEKIKGVYLKMRFNKFGIYQLCKQLSTQ